MAEELKTNNQKLEFVKSIFKEIWGQYRYHAIEMNKSDIGDYIKQKAESELREKYKNINEDELEKKLKEESDSEFERQAKLYTHTNQEDGNLIRVYNGDVFRLEDILISDDGKNIIFGVNVKFNEKNVRDRDKANYSAKGIEKLICYDSKNKLSPKEINGDGDEKFTEGKDGGQNIPSKVITIKYEIPLGKLNSTSSRKYIKDLFIQKIGGTISTIRDPHNILNQCRY